MRLISIERDGIISEQVGQLPEAASGAIAATTALYESVGYSPPWICYVATTGDRAVGTCGFTAAPSQGRVEIAYFTFPNYEGKGIATQMARQLVAIAHSADSEVIVTANTLPARNASHRILEKLGFACVGLREHPEDGTVLEWQKA